MANLECFLFISKNDSPQKHCDKSELLNLTICSRFA